MLTGTVLYCLQSNIKEVGSMKKAIIIICTVGALLLILDSMNAANALLLFLFAGIIPGTDLLVSPIDMMAATATAITVVILRVALWPHIRSSLLVTAKTTPHAKRVTRKAA